MAQVRERISGLVSNAWLGLDDYRGKDIDRFVSQAVTAVTSGQRTIAQLTNAYLAQMAGMALSRAVAPEVMNLSQLTGSSLRGIDMALEYRRPAVALYSTLSSGGRFTDAVKVGLERAQSLSATDLQLAKTHTVAASKRIIGYRRTLSGMENCELCPLAAAHRYNRGDLMPIHPHCDCGVVPIFSKFDPPAPEPVVTDRAIAVRQHGELGPVLTWADQHFTGPDDLH